MVLVFSSVAFIFGWLDGLSVFICSFYVWLDSLIAAPVAFMMVLALSSVVFMVALMV